MKDTEAENKIKEVSISMNWAFGFHLNENKHPLYFLDDNGTEKIIYYTAKIVIIFFTKLNEQKHYIEHEKEIQSLALSSCNLIASGEHGNKPAIHIWDYNKLQSINIIRGIHKNGVLYMEFLNNNQFLATCSGREKS